MEDITNDSTEKDKKNPLFDNVEIFECQWFFNSFDQNKRKEIFDIIYNFLFKESEESKKKMIHLKLKIIVLRQRMLNIIIKQIKKL